MHRIPIKDTSFDRLTIDIDSTVTVVFGEQEGAAGVQTWPPLSKSDETKPPVKPGKHERGR